jgi:hypothetical protein
VANSLEPGQVVWTFCATCKRETRHAIIQSVDVTIDPEPEGPPFPIEEKHQIVSCQGCERHSFRYGWSVSEEEEEDMDWTWAVYPEKETDRKPAFMTFFLPMTVKDLYLETLRAHNTGANILASAGLRATVEAICKERGFLRGDLKTKIDEMCAAGILPRDNAEYLHQHRFIGNNAVHDMEAPPADEFGLALEILEHLIKSLYEIPRRAERLMDLRLNRGAQIR